MLPGDGRYIMTTLSASDSPGFTVTKSVMVSPCNPARGLPSIDGSIVLHDSETGALKAVLQAGWVTAVRTAGLSAVVARRLANPEARSVAFIGCGVQARSHLAAFRALFPLEEVRAFGRGSRNRKRLCALAEAHCLSAQDCTTPREALEGADLVVSSVTLSFESEPFLDAAWLKPGAFATITDAATPWHSGSLSAFDAIVIDDRIQEQASEKKMVRSNLVAGDCKDLVVGSLDLRFRPDRRTAFVFRGLAIGDFALACLAYRRANETGAGQRLSMGD